MSAPRQLGYEKSKAKLIYLITNDLHFFAFISEQLSHFGYYVQEVRGYKKFSTVTASHRSVAVLIDVTTEDNSSIEEIDDIKELKETTIPKIFISDSDTQAIRLASIRMGGVAFFTKPVNIVALIAKLDTLDSQSSIPQPYRVLIIEDQQPVAKYYQMILNMSGMESHIVLDPHMVLKHIREFHPDLILIDAAMHGINGADIARIIRQIDEYIGIPIIFLSNDDDFGKRIEALDLGGDDFLLKPIKASHLIAVVRSRLERLKTLRSYMFRDSLTNLLNHTAFRSVLAKEVERAARSNNAFALAMMDLDHFKKVNDTHGHAAGDSVLKSLARLLIQRLRKSDIIGRYGGEEFVALLPDCNAEQAFQIMNDIRKSFSEIEFYHSEKSVFSVTFSCGISTYPEAPNAKLLSDSADQALYVAKANGRNQIQLAAM